MKKFIGKIQDRLDGSLVQHSLNPSHPNSLSHQLAFHTFSYFYSPQNGQFQARSKSESTLGPQDHFGYVVWPVIIAVHCFAETLPQQQLHTAIMCLQAYWNPSRHAFCAWKMFPGNEDIYFDDNAHAAQALISVYEATGEKKWLKQAREILEGLLMPAATKDGGIPWHINNSNARNACSTGPSAVAALRLDAIEHDHKLIVFAERSLNWVILMLRDSSDGLICDGLTMEDNGKATVHPMKWTYNIGFVIHGFALLYERTRKHEHLNTAISLAHSALNRNSSLFDHSVSDPAKRMYSDSSFFLHHLVDGYRVLLKHADTERLRQEIHHIASWGREWMYDSDDGLFFRGSVPHTIDECRVNKFNGKFGTRMELKKNEAERDEAGQLCKTLIGCASWSRILLANEAMQRE